MAINAKTVEVKNSLPDYILKSLYLLDYTLLCRLAVEQGVPINKIPDLPTSTDEMLDRTLYIMGKIMSVTFKDCVVRASDHSISIRISDMSGNTEAGELHSAYLRGWINDRDDVREAVDQRVSILSSINEPWGEVASVGDRQFIRIYPHEVRYSQQLNHAMASRIVQFYNNVNQLHGFYEELKERIEREKEAAALRERMRREREQRVREAQREMATKVSNEFNEIALPLTQARSRLDRSSSQELGDVTNMLAQIFANPIQSEPVVELVVEPDPPVLVEDMRPALVEEVASTPETPPINVTVTVDTGMTPNQIFQRLFEEQYRARREQQNVHNS